MKNISFFLYAPKHFVVHESDLSSEDLIEPVYLTFGSCSFFTGYIYDYLPDYWSVLAKHVSLENSSLSIDFQNFTVRKLCITTFNTILTILYVCIHYSYRFKHCLYRPSVFLAQTTPKFLAFSNKLCWVLWIHITLLFICFCYLFPRFYYLLIKLIFNNIMTLFLFCSYQNFFKLCFYLYIHF